MGTQGRGRIIVEAGLVLAAVAGLAACGSSGGHKVSSNPPTTQAPAATTQAPTTQAPTTSTPPTTKAKAPSGGGVAY